MNEQGLDRIVSRPALVADAAAGSCEPVAAVGRESGELLDDDLEHVVGGLARVWIDSATISREAHGQHGRHGV